MAVFGAGAVGCYFGIRLAQAGAPVVLIGRPDHVRAINQRGLLFESDGKQRSIPIEASTDASRVGGAQWVLFCVKSGDTAEGARQIARHLAPDALVASLQNGVENAAVLRDSAGIDAMAAVVYVATSMPAPGHLRHAGRGDLTLGEAGPPPPGHARDPDRVRRMAAVFERAGVPCRISPDARVDLWIKLLINCAYNAVSALGRSRYGPMLDRPDVVSMMRTVIDEASAVAHADGVPLPDTDALLRSALETGERMREASSSTAQDLARGKPTEIESLNGYVVRRGQALGLPTPVNTTLLTLVRLLESRTIGVSSAATPPP